MSLLNADTPDFSALLDSLGINLLWHPSHSRQSGQELLDLLEDCAQGRIRLEDVLCLEGALLCGSHNTRHFHRLQTMHWLPRLAGAAWGGVSATSGFGHSQPVTS